MNALGVCGIDSQREKRRNIAPMLADLQRLVCSTCYMRLPFKEECARLIRLGSGQRCNEVHLACPEFCRFADELRGRGMSMR